jgi:hypothetical protein
VSFVLLLIGPARRQQVLKSMGVRAAFDQPDLSRASASPLVVTDVLQSVSLSVQTATDNILAVIINSLFSLSLLGNN